mgnify:CR=1 FL=1
MKMIGFLLLCALFMTGCKSTERYSDSEDDVYKREPTVIALEIQVEKKSQSGDFEVLKTQINTLEYPVSPRPTGDSLPEVFKAEVLDASNKIVFGSRYKTSFVSEKGSEVVNLKFFCSSTRNASLIKVYYQVADGVWKQIKTIDL